MLELLFQGPRLASLRVFTPTIICELLSLEGRADVMLRDTVKTVSSVRTYLS